MNDKNATANSPKIPPKIKAWPMYRAVVGVGVACGLAIVSVFELTGPVIQQNKIELRQKAIFEVLPGAMTSAAFRLTGDDRFEPTSSDSEGSDLVFAGFDDDSRLVGLAIETQGMGYQDVVRILYGYSFETETILGISVLESRETPGLGDRIETDEDFLGNFGILDVSLSPSGNEVAHPIEFVKPGKKTDPWQIDGISGATITSRATANMLRASTVWWIPRVRAQREDFEEPNGEE